MDCGQLRNILKEKGLKMQAILETISLCKNFDGVVAAENISIKVNNGEVVGIIGANVLVAITVMLPLLFSNLVEVINFALSSIFGALLGYLISRPAYAFLLESLFLKNEH